MFIKNVSVKYADTASCHFTGQVLYYTVPLSSSVPAGHAAASCVSPPQSHAAATFPPALPCAGKTAQHRGCLREGGKSAVDLCRSAGHTPILTQFLAVCLSQQPEVLPSLLL